ncbi:MAG: DUF6491 family protein [Rhodospirillaceae bacterium]|nr:DUF6491 family protein [Rhodospirillaceae bacterium]
MRYPSPRRRLNQLALGLALGLGVIAAAAAQDRPMGIAPNPGVEAGPNDANDPGYILEQFPDRLPQTTNQCIFFRTLYDWRPLNNTSLIVWAPSRNHPYHIQLDQPCNGLRFAHSIGFTSRDSRLCGFGGDSVLVESSGGRPDRCPIGSITKLTEESLAALLAQAPGRSLQDKRAAEETAPK